MREIRTPDPTVEEVLDIQHDPYPAQQEGDARHIPHLGHVALLLGLLAVSALVSVSVFALLLHRHPLLKDSVVVQLLLEALIFLLTLGSAYKVFPLLWRRSFPSGLEWNAPAVRRNWPRLLATGILLCALAQTAQRFVRIPEETEVDKVLSTQAGAWGALALGVLLAPMCEEILFRGFLLPAFAIAYDWLSLDRSPAGLERWRTSTQRSTAAAVFGAVMSSILFGAMHAPQLRYAWGVVAVITCVGLTLAYVRLRLHSVACSTLVHATYNGTLFAAMLIQTHGFRHLERLRS